MIELFKAAKDDEKNLGYTFFLNGDLSQMSNQRSFLSSKGISLKQNNVYPCLRDIDVKKALTLIWENRVDGWWHYKERYVQHEICTEEQFNNRLKSS